MSEWADLECPQCDWHTACGPVQMLTWLHGVGMVRRDVAPEPDLLPELFRTAAPRFACPKCHQVGLTARPSEPLSDEDWGMARKCDDCGSAIPRERLEVFPATRLCVACQSKSDRGESSEAAEYCPRCGNVMTLRQSRQGLTRYVMACPSCRS